jgi:anti-sigma B factor antagonist
MFEIESASDGRIIARGRLDAAQATKAEAFLAGISGDFVIDLAELDYISSAGLGVLLKTHKQLVSSGRTLRLVKVSNHIADIFKYSGFDRLFTIEKG